MHSRPWSFLETVKNLFARKSNDMDELKENKPNLIATTPHVLNIKISHYLSTIDATHFSMTTKLFYRQSHQDPAFWSMHIKPGYHFLLNNLKETGHQKLLTIDVYRETYYLISKTMPVYEDGLIYRPKKELSSKAIWNNLDLNSPQMVTIFAKREEAISYTDSISLSDGEQNAKAQGFYNYPIVCTVKLKNIKDVKDVKDGNEEKEQAMNASQTPLVMLKTPAENIAKIYRFFYKAGYQYTSGRAEKIFDKEFDQRVTKSR